MMTLRPKAILFDLDGTLFDRDTSFLELVQSQYRTFTAVLQVVPCEVFVRRVVERDEHGYVDKALVYRDVAREFRLPEMIAEQLTVHFLDTYASFSRCFPEVLSALAELRAQGMKLAIITNGSAKMQEKKIRG
jgi:putative hydrolase of the HAD superfamily